MRDHKSNNEKPMKKMLFAGAFLAAIATTGTAHAAGAEFSAVTVQIRPGRDIETGSIYVSKAATRYEFRQRGLPVVRITMPDKGLIRFLFPIDKSYIEYKIKPGSAVPGSRQQKPCQATVHIRCKLLSTQDQINGMKAERWSIKPERGPGEIRLWWDPIRKMPLREEHADGRVMQATLRDTQEFENQNVEDWEFTYMSPDGRYRRSVSLISPELGVAVVEMLPGGIIRRLHSVTIGTPDAKLFEVPAGYRLIKRPNPPAAPSFGAQQPPRQQQRGTAAQQNTTTRSPPAAAAPNARGGGQAK